jgi:hypothetical protein
MAFEVPAIGSANTAADPKIKTAIEGLNSWTGTYRMLVETGMARAAADLPAGTYFLTAGATNILSTAASPITLTSGNAVPIHPVYFDDADYLVAGLTQKLRIRAQAACNATKAAIKFTFGLYPITVAGGVDEMVVTAGTVVAGSTVEINEPAASTVTSGAGSDFTIPSDGLYGLAVVTSATLTNNSSVAVSAQLQTRSA